MSVYTSPPKILLLWNFIYKKIKNQLSLELKSDNSFFLDYKNSSDKLSTVQASNDFRLKMDKFKIWNKYFPYNNLDVILKSYNLIV